MEKLEDLVAHELYASHHVPTIDAAIIAVVLNSLQSLSPATHQPNIRIAIRPSNLNFSVYDNGSGIDPKHLMTSIGEYNMSNANKVSSLACIGLLGKLEIESRPAIGVWKPKRKIIQFGKLLRIEASESKQQIGTLVKVTDMYQKFPVRLKYMLKERKRVIRSVRKWCTKLVMNRKNISIEMIDIERQKILLRVAPAASIQKRFERFYGEPVASLLHSVSYSDKILSVVGLLALPSVDDIDSTERQGPYQFCYLNGTPITDSSPILKHINNLFQKLYSKEKKRSVSNKRRARCSVNPPNFCLELVMKDTNSFEIIGNGEAQEIFMVSLSDFQASLQAFVEAYLSKNNVAPASSSSIEDQQESDFAFSNLLHSCHARQPKSPEVVKKKSRFGAGVVASDPVDIPEVLNQPSISNNSACDHDETLFDSPSENFERIQNLITEFHPDNQFIPEEPGSKFISQEFLNEEVNSSSQGGEVDFINEFASLSNLISSSSMMHHDYHHHHASCHDCSLQAQMTTSTYPSVNQEPLSLHNTAAESSEDVHRSFFESALFTTDHDSPVRNIKQNPQNAIRVVKKIASPAVSTTIQPLHFTEEENTIISNDESTTSNKPPQPVSIYSIPRELKEMRVEKSVMKTMRVISQVDNKFILVTDGKTLYGLDQHAVDERIKLEALELKIKTIIQVVEFPEPKLVAVSADELDILKSSSSRTIISNWGFKYEIIMTAGDNKAKGGKYESTLGGIASWETTSRDTLTSSDFAASVNVLGCPCIDGRVASPSDFREYLAFLLKRNIINDTARPPVITRLLHSRACRSAIMFGDPLTLEECETLLSELIKCKMPFQCAHGRPSIVPLVKLKE